MSAVRRLFAVLFGILLLQLTLLGSGTMCALPHAASRGGDDAHAMCSSEGMSAIDMANAPSGIAVVPDAETRPVNSDACGAFGLYGGCRLPWAPGHCSSMTACSITAAPAASASAYASTQAVALVVPGASFAHVGPTLRPELPPPRA